MKIKFLLSLKSNTHTTTAFRKISEYLKGMGHKVDDKVLNINPQEYIKAAEDNILDVYKKIEKSMKVAECIIADVTFPSSGIGYLIAEALDNKKPVLALYRKDRNTKQLPVPIYAIKNRLLTSKIYTSDNLKQIVTDFINRTKQKIDTKFILIISPEIDRYLEWASDYKRIHKAEAVREAIDDKMEKDEDYKEYLKESK